MAAPKRSGSGSGCRPPSPTGPVTGSARSYSRSTYAAPGTCPARNCSWPSSRPSCQRTSRTAAPPPSPSSARRASAEIRVPTGPSLSGERQRFADHGHRLRAGGRERAAVVLAAQHLVADLGRLPVALLDVADDDHVALGDHLAVLRAGVVGGPLAAPAQRLDLQHVHAVG